MHHLRVGLLGLGNVAAGVCDILHEQGQVIAQRTGIHIVLQRAYVRDTRKSRMGAAARIECTTRIEDILESPDIDVVVELMGGLDPAADYIQRALQAHKPVITANKAVIAKYGQELFALAQASHTDVYFEAAVAGGIPIIRTLREGLAGDRISHICGILNGTTNFILSKMGEGATYAEALKQAQHLGFAEADPTLDVSGGDAADKIAILSQLGFGAHLTSRDVFKRGITALTPAILQDAESLGYRVKLLARARRVMHRHVEYLDVSVQPTFVPQTHPLSGVSGSQNAIFIQSDALGPSFYQGAGAGSLPTGTAVVADLIEAGRHLRAGVSGRVVIAHDRAAPPVLPNDEAQSAYYVRLGVVDKPGVIAAITQVLAKHQISLSSVLQRDRSNVPIPLVLTTHQTTAGAMYVALQEIEALQIALEGPQCVAIEHFD